MGSSPIILPDHIFILFLYSTWVIFLGLFWFLFVLNLCCTDIEWWYFIESWKNRVWHSQEATLSVCGCICVCVYTHVYLTWAHVFYVSSSCSSPHDIFFLLFLNITDNTERVILNYVALIIELIIHWYTNIMIIIPSPDSLLSLHQWWLII